MKLAAGLIGMVAVGGGVYYATHRGNADSAGEEVITGARDLYGRWGSLSFAEKRTILETIVAEIVIGDTIEISLAYIPGNSANNATSQHERVAFFPSGKHTISAVIPKPSEPLSPSTLAEHLKCCRQRSGL